MAAQNIQLFINDARVRIGWLADKSGGYRFYNVYWDTQLDMSTEAVLVRNVSNSAGSFVGADKYIFHDFERSSIGQTIENEFYVRLKGILSSGVEDGANPGETKIIPSLSNAVEEYHSVQLYGWDYDKKQWRRLNTTEDGSLSVRI